MTRVRRWGARGGRDESVWCGRGGERWSEVRERQYRLFCILRPSRRGPPARPTPAPLLQILTVPRPTEGSLRPSERVNSVVGILFWMDLVEQTMERDEESEVRESGKWGSYIPRPLGSRSVRSTARVNGSCLRGVFGEYPLTTTTTSGQSSGTFRDDTVWQDHTWARAEVWVDTCTPLLATMHSEHAGVLISGTDVLTPVRSW